MIMSKEIIVCMYDRNVENASIETNLGGLVIIDTLSLHCGGNRFWSFYPEAED